MRSPFGGAPSSQKHWHGTSPPHPEPLGRAPRAWQRRQRARSALNQSLAGVAARSRWNPSLTRPRPRTRPRPPRRCCPRRRASRPPELSARAMAAPTRVLYTDFEAAWRTLETDACWRTLSILAEKKGGRPTGISPQELNAVYGLTNQLCTQKNPNNFTSNIYHAVGVRGGGGGALACCAARAQPRPSARATPRPAGLVRALPRGDRRTRDRGPRRR